MLTASERLTMTSYTFTVGQAGRLRTFAAAAAATGDTAGADDLEAESQRLFGEAKSVFLDKVTTIVAAHAPQVQVAYESIIAGTALPGLGLLLGVATFAPVRAQVDAAGGNLPEALAVALTADDFLGDVWDAVSSAAVWIADHIEPITDLVGFLSSLF